MSLRFKRWLRLAGFPADDAEMAADNFANVVREEFTVWLATLPRILLRSYLAKQRRLVAKEGIVLVRIDRNPGRVIALCVEGWKALNRTVFYDSPRYVATAATLANDDEDYVNDTIASFHAALREVGDIAEFRGAAKAWRPQAYWVIKQKSVVEHSDTAVAKFRPAAATPADIRCERQDAPCPF